MTKLADLRTGDVLAWKHDHRSKLSNLFIEAIRFVTGGNYGHVALVVVIFGIPFVIEASLPLVRISLVRPEEEVFYIPLPKRPDQTVLSFFLDLVGLDYGIMDALRAAFGKVSKRDDKWQCAEMLIEYFKQMEYDLPVCEDTPDAVVQMLCSHFGVVPELITE